jgi:hypothetical protein
MSETDDSGSAEEQTTNAPSESPMLPTQEAPVAQLPETSGMAEPALPKPEGRRTQLKIVRENIQSLSRDMGSFRKSTEASTRKLEAHLTSLRKDLATHIRSKDLGDHVKSHESGAKRLEKQIVTLRSELASLRSQMTKDAAKSRAREEAMLSKIVAKAKTARPTKLPKRAKSKTSKSKK